MQTGKTRDRPRSGRPRLTTAAQDRRIRLSHLRDHFRYASLAARDIPRVHNNRINTKTVNRRLRENHALLRRKSKKHHTPCLC